MSPPPSSPSSKGNASEYAEPDASQPPTPPAGPEFSAEERNLLLKLAHDAIHSALAGTKLALDPPTPHLAEPRGVFTSLYIGGELRGCVGYVLPAGPLYHAVAETARAAAFQDSRFDSLKPEEESLLRIELSILSRPQPILPGEIEVGRHGLLIVMHGHRGLLLPQVPVEHGWDRTTFLEQTCRKAGLPVDAWQMGASIEAFTAVVFGDM